MNVDSNVLQHGTLHRISACCTVLQLGLLLYVQPYVPDHLLLLFSPPLSSMRMPYTDEDDDDDDVC
jgi:hypothetical protein